MADGDDRPKQDALSIPPALPTFAEWKSVIAAWREGGGEAVKAMTVGTGTENAKDETNRAITDFEGWYKNPEQRAGTALGGLGEAQEALFQNAMQFSLTIAKSMQAPWGAVFSAWVKEHPDAVKAMLDKHNSTDARLNSHYLRADLMEAVGKAVKYESEAVKHESEAVKHESKLFNSEKNNALLTKNSKGEFEVVDEQKIIELAQGGVHVITTGTHAFFEKKDDLTAVTDAFGRIAATAMGDAAPRLKTIDAHPQPGDTVLVAMTNTRENNFLNLASLFRRVGDAREHINKPESDDFRHLLPMALHTARLLLKSIVTNPEAIQELRYDESGTMQAMNQPDHQGAAPLLFNQPIEQPIELRPDAPEILRHYLLHAFSMGGNAQRDGALRFLVHQLDAKAKDGRPLVTLPEGVTIQDLIGSISQIATGLNEENIADYYIQRGAEGHLVSNKEDTIVAPSSGPHRSQDPRFDYAGNAKVADGHAPFIMADGIIGSHDRELMFRETNKVDGDPYLLDQYRCAYAAASGKAAITHVEVNADRKSLMLEVAPGTSKELFEGAQQSLVEALAAEGLHARVKETKGLGRRRFALHSDDTLSADALQKIHTAFTALQADPEVPLYISPVVTKHELTPHIGHTKMLRDLGIPHNWIASPGAIAKNSALTRRVSNQGNKPPESYVDIIAKQGSSTTQTISPSI